MDKFTKRLRKSWYDMIRRCYNPKCKDYKYYGGKGVRVCATWKDNFEAFYLWAMTHGYRSNLTIDRIDSNGHYVPENCRWKTQAENSGRAHRGSNDSRAKLTELQVMWIRKNSHIGSRALSEAFNISQSRICDIIARRAWKHI